jgi:type I restriction enzyme S subunit
MGNICACTKSGRAKYNYVTFERYVESPELMLKEGDILLTKDGSTLGTTNIVTNLSASGTVNSSIAIIRLKRGFDNKYFYYQIRSNYIQNTIQLKKDGMGVPHLFQKDINNFIVLIPPLEEQRDIVSFLDKKATFIDKKIELLNRKINSYKDLRKTIINRVVYQGLDENIKLKDSGIDWIGKIPEHWEVKRVNDVVEERSEKVSDTNYSPLSVSMKGIVPQMEGTAKTKNNDDRKKVLKGDIVINSRSDRRGASGLSSYIGSVSVVNIVLKLKHINGGYIHYLLKTQSFTDEFYKKGKGIVDDLWSTKYSTLKTFQICIPPTSEQIRIVEYLEVKTKITDDIIENIYQQIAKLQELRKTLINDVVTGKIKVTE